MSNLEKINTFSPSVARPTSFFLVTLKDRPIAVVEAESISAVWTWVEGVCGSNDPLESGYEVNKISYYKV